MSDRRRYYLTTAIAYANNAPGLHTVYEVIGADVIARWHRMMGDDTRFLTGTDEHSVNIAQSAEARGPHAARRSSTRRSSCSRSAEDALLIAPTGSSGRPIPTTTGRPRRWSGGRTPTATSTSAPTRAGTARTRASRRPRTCSRRRTAMQCPNHPDVELQWLTERNWFFRLSAYQERLLDHYEEHPDFVQPEYRRNEMLGFIRQGLEDFSISRADATWGIPFPIGEDGQTAQREDGSWDPEAGHDLRLVRRADQLHHRRGLPGRPRGVRARGGRRTCTSSARTSRGSTRSTGRRCCGRPGIEAPRQVWVHGFCSSSGEQMSKSRGNFLDPAAMVAAFGADGARYVTLREVAVRPRRRRLVGLVRAPLQRRPRQRLRQPREPHRHDGQPLPRRRAAGAPRRRPTRRWAPAGPTTLRRYRERLEGCLLHDALAELWEFVGGANKTVDAEQPWTLAKAAKAGDADGGRAAARRCSATSWRRAGSSASPSRRSCRRWRRACSSSSASPTATRPTATAGRRSSTSLAWGADADGAGQVIDTPTPLFPRHRERGCRGPAGLIVRLVDSHGHVNADRFADDVDARPRRGPPRRRRADPRPGLEPRVVRAGPRARRIATRGSTPRSASTRTTRPRSTDADWAAIEAWSRDERVVAIGETGPRLGPDVLALGRPAREPAAEPRARARDRQAGDPPLPVEGRRARRAGRPARRAALRPGSTARRRSWRSGTGRRP